MDIDLIKAHLNLYAVFQNLEALPALDAETADRIKDWDLAIQISVRNGPNAFLEFKGGACTHGRGTHPNPAIKLFLMSPAHLNAMFDGKSNPIPLKGFTRLGFLQRDFAALTDRLTYFLRPTEELLADEAYLKTNTALTLFTGSTPSRNWRRWNPRARRSPLTRPKARY